MSVEELSVIKPKPHPTSWEYVGKGWQCLTQTDGEGAYTCFTEGLQFARGIHDRYGEAHLINGMGCLQNTRGEFAEAMEHFQTAHAMFTEFQDEQQCAGAIGNMANIYFAQWLYEEAEIRYQQIVQLDEKIVGAQNYLTTLLNIGACFFYQAKYTEARAVLGDVLRRLPHTKDTSDKRNTLHRARTYNILASIAFIQGEYAHGRQHIKKAREAAKSVANREEEAVALLSLGIYGKQNNRASLEKALVISQEIQVVQLSIQIHDALVALHRKNRRWELALEHLTESQALTKQIFSPKANQSIETVRRKELTEALKTAQTLREEAQRLANQDSLTGLHNRRYIDTHLKQLFNHAKQTNIALVVVLLDIDNFKHVNDTYTHTIGDKVLCDVAQLLTNGIRSTDLVGRYGGEEFVIVLSHMSYHDAWQMCDRIRQNIANYNWDKIIDGLKVTISAGICGDISLINHEKMLQIADKNLYQAKHNGKNIVYRPAACPSQRGSEPTA
jgi:diguanylate cyclase (GGDEF)-like protein